MAEERSTILFWSIIVLCTLKVSRKQRQPRYSTKSSLRKVSGQIALFNVYLCAEGEWKGAKDGGVDPFKDLRQSYENMVDGKQTMD